MRLQKSRWVPAHPVCAYFFLTHDYKMTSIGRAPRQIPLSTTYYGVPSSLANVYDFNPTSANVVGNYPPGYMTVTTIPSIPSGSVMRDLGKTVFATVGSAGTNFGWFRAVQIITPTAITSAQGFIGGTAGNLFGEGGANYYKCYIPVVLGGIAATTPNQLTPIAGGQM
jgi:hypothetical protein